MKKVTDWENVQAAQENRILPVDGYICKILDAEVKSYTGKDGNPFERLEISIDIAAGDYKDFYAADYRAQVGEDKRWKGVLKLYTPKDDGSEKDAWTKKRLKASIEAIEESNSGYHWDWNEKGLKGKKVGCVFQNTEWEYNGRTGWKAQPFKVVAVDMIQSGNFKIPADKPLKDAPPVAGASDFTAMESVSDDDLPF